MPLLAQIRMEHGAKRGGKSGRNACSLQNRCNKILQMEVNKYIALLISILRVYHSGWILLEDYVHDAKRKFLVKFGKGSKHEMVDIVLKKSGLPKYGALCSFVRTTMQSHQLRLMEKAEMLLREQENLCLVWKCALHAQALEK